MWNGTVGRAAAASVFSRRTAGGRKGQQMDIEAWQRKNAANKSGPEDGCRLRKSRNEHEIVIGSHRTALYTEKQVHDYQKIKMPEIAGVEDVSASRKSKCEHKIVIGLD